MAIIQNSTGVNVAGVDANGNLQVGATLGTPNQLLQTKPIIASADSFYHLRVQMDPTSLFYDGFDEASLDTVDRWTSLGTVTPSLSTGSLNMAVGTTASATCILETQAKFALNAYARSDSAYMCKIDAAATTNNYRFFGQGTTPGSVTTSTPVQDGIGFELDTTGNLNCVVWTGGVKTYSQTVTRPSDGGNHRYSIEFKPSNALWYIDDTTIPVASVALNSPAVETLPLLILSVNGSTPPSASPTFLFQAVSIGDTGRNNFQVSDGTMPWRKARVTAASSLQVISQASDLCVTATGTSGQSVTATLPAVSSAYHYITNIMITKYSAAALTASATPVVVTSTNLPGSMAFTFDAAASAQGTISNQSMSPQSPIKSSVVNTATTIVCPAVTNVIWRITVNYFTAN
jgi:hypothetical protein